MWVFLDSKNRWKKKERNSCFIWKIWNMIFLALNNIAFLHIGRQIARSFKLLQISCSNIDCHARPTVSKISSFKSVHCNKNYSVLLHQTPFCSMQRRNFYDFTTLLLLMDWLITTCQGYTTEIHAPTYLTSALSVWSKENITIISDCSWFWNVPLFVGSPRWQASQCRNSPKLQEG